MNNRRPKDTRARDQRQRRRITRRRRARAIALWARAIERYANTPDYVGLIMAARAEQTASSIIGPGKVGRDYIDPVAPPSPLDTYVTIGGKPFRVAP